MAAVGSPGGEGGCRLSHRLTGDQGQRVSPRLVLLTQVEIVLAADHTHGEWCSDQGSSLAVWSLGKRSYGAGQTGIEPTRPLWTGILVATGASCWEISPYSLPSVARSPCLLSDPQ